MVKDGNALVKYHWSEFIQDMRSCNWFVTEAHQSFNLRQVLRLVQEGYVFERPSGFDTVLDLVKRKGYEEITLLLMRIDALS